MAGGELLPFPLFPQIHHRTTRHLPESPLTKQVEKLGSASESG